jgi:hypothetical protein
MEGVSVMHDLYTNVDDMLRPETLSMLVNAPIQRVELRPLAFETSRSGSVFQAITTNNGRGPSFFLKRVSFQRDWVMRATNDTRCRSVTLWQYGLLDRLQPEVNHTIVACARDGDGWAILMHDVSDALVDAVDRPVGRLEDAVLFPLLDGLAKLHATYWESPELSKPELGLCSPYDRYLLLSPTIARQMLDEPSQAPMRILEGQKVLPKYLDPDLCDTVNRLLIDPTPLLTALSKYPQTLVHGDASTNNAALRNGGEVTAVLLDWQLATTAPVTVDLFWLLHDRVTEPALADRYLSSLATHLGYRLPEKQWQDLLALGALSQLVTGSCFVAYFAEHGGSEELTDRMCLQLESLAATARPAENLL